MTGPTSAPEKPTRTEYIAEHRKLLALRDKSNVDFKLAMAEDDLASAEQCVSELNLAKESFSAFRSKLTARELFILKYNITTGDPSGHEVQLELPKGVSRAQFLLEAQALGVGGQNAVWPAQLTKWLNDEAFKSGESKITKLRIDGNVAGSTDKTRELQEDFLTKKGVAMPSLEDLAVAHVAFFILAGNDLFQGNVVRARGWALNFDADGLSVSDWLDAYRYDLIAAAAVLSPRN